MRALLSVAARLIKRIDKVDVVAEWMCNAVKVARTCSTFGEDGSTFSQVTIDAPVAVFAAPVSQPDDQSSYAPAPMAHFTAFVVNGNGALVTVVEDGIGEFHERLQLGFVLFTSGGKHTHTHTLTHILHKQCVQHRGQRWSASASWGAWPVVEHILQVFLHLSSVVHFVRWEVSVAEWTTSVTQLSNVFSQQGRWWGARSLQCPLNQFQWFHFAVEHIGPVVQIRWSAFHQMLQCRR